MVESVEIQEQAIKILSEASQRGEGVGFKDLQTALHLVTGYDKDIVSETIKEMLYRHFIQPDSDWNLRIKL